MGYNGLRPLGVAYVSCAAYLTLVWPVCAGGVAAYVGSPRELLERPKTLLDEDGCFVRWETSCKKIGGDKLAVTGGWGSYLTQQRHSEPEQSKPQGYKVRKR
jgi:hypothetical protein